MISSISHSPLFAFTIPDVLVTVEMGGECDEAEVEEGIAFSPVYHLGVRKTVSEGGVKTWLRLRKAY